MSTTNGPSTENAMVLTPRQEKLIAMRDEMAPGAKPGAIVPRTFAEAQAMCQALSRSGLVPSQYIEHPEDLIVTIMSGAEIGIPPMASIRLYHIMDRIPRLSAEGIRAVLLSHPEIEYFEPQSGDDKQATWIGKRRGRPEKSATWTVDRAKRAGLWDRKNRDGSPGNWQKYTEDMLNARASMQLGRMLAPDVIAGMVSREEAADGDFIEAAFTETKPQFAAPLAMPNNTSGGNAPAMTWASNTQGVNESGVFSPSPTNGPPPGVPQAPTEPPKRGPGRPPKERSADPTLSSPAPSAVTTQQPQSVSNASSAHSDSTSSVAEPSRLDAAVHEVAQKRMAAAMEERLNPTSPGSSSVPTPSVESAAASTAATISGAAPVGGDDFGSEDPVDVAPRQPTMADFMAWVAGCKTQRDLASGLGTWRAWSKQMCEAGDESYKKTGANTVAMQDAYSKRKGEVPA